MASLPSCLVVEDDELIAHVLVHLLNREGYKVDRCADGRAAQQAIEQAKEPPGLILLDVMLPYVDGFELIQVIREQKRWTDVPIIMLTAKQQENDIVRALDAGATDYVVKPFQPNELMARLRRILRKKG
ncbi:MAG: response regulator transcription factor [Proteobacteria bacterium]|nr:response regulator transcription factor [Pseudomonadota bacterium]